MSTESIRSMIETAKRDVAQSEVFMQKIRDLGREPDQDMLDKIEEQKRQIAISERELEELVNLQNPNYDNSNELDEIEGDEFENEYYEIGDQVWMRNNLDVSTYNNGDPLPYADNQEKLNDFIEKEEGCYSYFKFNANNTALGKRYNYYALNDPRGLVPDGFKIPSEDEWRILIDSLGGIEEVDVWVNEIQDRFGFYLSLHQVQNGNLIANFWCSDENSFLLMINTKNEVIAQWSSDGLENKSFSIRCISD
jgi:uncharacterized protein (TIGR02145 family)